MKIAITFLTFGLDAFGGMERATFFLACGLVGEGCDVVVLTSRAFTDGTTINGVRVIPMDSVETTFFGGDAGILAQFALHHDAISSELLGILAREKPDYILAIDPVWGIIPLLNIWRALSSPVALVFHVSHSEEILSRVAGMPFTNLFAVSESLMIELRDRSPLLASRAIHLLPNCVRVVDFSDVSVVRTNAIFGNARLSKEKGTIDLISAFAAVAPVHPELVLWLCGGDFPFGDRRPGRLEAEIAIRANGIPIERVQFLPRSVSYTH